MPAIVPLEFAGVGKHFGRLAVLRRIDLKVATGEVVGLLGANGCGKTTLLSIAAGLLTYSSGTRTYGPDRCGELDLQRRRGLAFVAHSTQLYQRLTARENVQLCLELRACGGPTPGKDVIDPLLARVGLAAAANRLVSTFSRGMQQRLAIARALAGAPELLLLDEPFTALDHGGRAVLTGVLRQERDRGSAVLLSSHDLDAVAEVSDRAVLLADGRIVAAATRITAADPTGEGFGARLRDMGQGRAPAEVA